MKLIVLTFFLLFQLTCQGQNTYYLISGSFSKAENAERRLEQVREMGFERATIMISPQKYNQVCLDSFYHKSKIDAFIQDEVMGNNMEYWIWMVKNQSPANYNELSIDSNDNEARIIPSEDEQTISVYEDKEDSVEKEIDSDREVRPQNVKYVYGLDTTLAKPKAVSKNINYSKEALDWMKYNILLLTMLFVSAVLLGAIIWRHKVMNNPEKHREW